MYVSRVLQGLRLHAEPRWRDEERIDLIAARGAVRSYLVIERDDVGAVICAEENAVSGIRLIHEILNRAEHMRVGAVGDHWIASLESPERRALSHGFLGAALDLNSVIR